MTSELEPIDAEVVPERLGDAEAKRFDIRLRLTVGTVRDGVAKLQDLVHEAKVNNVHEQLGFASWSAYVVDVFGGEALSLDREGRRELVEILSIEGMSQRAIASTVKISKTTVRADLKVGQTDPPAIRPISAKLEQRRKHYNQPKPGTNTTEPVQDLDRIATVTGLDGKTYRKQSAPKPTTPSKRRSRPNGDPLVMFATANSQLRQIVPALKFIPPEDIEAVHERFSKQVVECFETLNAIRKEVKEIVEAQE